MKTAHIIDEAGLGIMLNGRRCLPRTLTRTLCAVSKTAAVTEMATMR
ncbi:hypothetical protein [Rhizobium acaciae]|nr:hypothetical protein [Rhizobium acaciae]MCW1750242.1 hypothetical protein [Rhizobium acaciae]